MLYNLIIKYYGKIAAFAFKINLYALRYYYNICYLKNLIM